TFSRLTLWRIEEQVAITPVSAPVKPAEVAKSAAASAATLGTARDWLRLIRPNQWVKNFFIIFPLLFSGNALHPGAVLRTALTFVVFCMLASGVYIWNDIIDRAQDAAHPTKRFRPIAAGLIGTRPAVFAGGALLILALSVASLLGPAIGVLAA